MGIFSSKPKWVANPQAQGVGQQYKEWGEGQGLGMAGRIAKGGLKQFANGGGAGGYDTGIVGNLLAPIRDAYATQQRDSARQYGMGGLGLMGGQNPNQIARLQQLAQDKIGEQQGHAYAEAVPGIFGQLSNTFQNAQQDRRQAELAGMGGQLQAASMGQWYQDPSFMQKLGMIGSVASQFASPFLAGGLGGVASSGGGMGGGSLAASGWGAAKGRR